MPGVQKTVAYPAISRPTGLHKSFGRTRMCGNNTSQAYGLHMRTTLKPGGSFFSAVANAAARSGNIPAKPMTTAVEQLKSCGSFHFASTLKADLPDVFGCSIMVDDTPAMPINDAHSGGFFVHTYTALVLHSFKKLIEARFSIAIDNLKIMHSCMIINANNTPQAYGQRKLATLKLGGYFFLGAE